ncbi:MAG: IPT/TIG domain-containing protein, partial [Deltaproteobacteria bacterium]|nr:IPT/TIG domain-containing protein [Deltaproteobacteria bacterium]
SGTEATQVLVQPDGRSLTCRTPPQLEGPAEVTVLLPDGLSGTLLGGFTYLPFLQLSFVVPPTGSLKGGQAIELSGGGFARGATVQIGSAMATNVRVLSPGRIQALTPPGPFGPADVLVTNPDGRRALAPGAYVYSDLVVSSVLGRYNPDVDGPIRPSHKLAQGRSGALALTGSTVWLLQHATVFEGAKTPQELLDKSIFGALALVDVTTPTAASVLGGLSLQPPYDPIDLAVRPPYAFVAAQAPTLQYVDVTGANGPSLLVIDGSDTAGPQLVTAVPFQGTAKGIALAGDLLLIAAHDAGVVLFSVADPTRPLLLGAVNRFLLNGQVQPVNVDGVHVSGKLAMLRIGDTYELVVDVSSPGLPVLGQITAGPNLGQVAFDNARGLATNQGSLYSLTLQPPARSRLVSLIPPLVSGTPFVIDAVGPQISVAGGSPTYANTQGGAGVLQIEAARDPNAPKAVDAVSLFPAGTLSAVALDSKVAVISVYSGFKATRESPEPLDALDVVALQFPLVASAEPADGELGVPVLTRPVFHMNRLVTGGDPSTTVKLLLEDGSSTGALVQATLDTSVGSDLRLVPAAPLLPSRTYKVVVDGVTDAATGSPMPAPFIAEFTTASAQAGAPLSLTSFTPRQGSSLGGTLLTLTGTGLEPGLEVRLGGAVATVQSVAPDGTSATVRTPPGAAGAASLLLRDPSGAESLSIGAFLYIDPLTVASVSPSRGPATGGTKVIVQGTGFSPAGDVQLTFGTTPALRTRLLGLNTMEAYTPAGLRGPVDVTVTNPDGTSATLSDGFIFDQPTLASVPLPSRVNDLVAIGTLAYAATADGLAIIDLQADIPPALRSGLWDNNHDGVDDRIIAQLPLGEALSISYPPEGGQTLYLGLRGATVARVNVTDPAHPYLLDSTGAGSDAVYELDARGDRLLAAAGTGGLRRYDITVPPFPIDDLSDQPVQALAVEKGLGVAVRGTRNGDRSINAGELRFLSLEGPMTPLGAVQLPAQRARLYGGLAYVAAGNAGFVIVDGRDPLQPTVLSTLAMPGFAWDVRLSGNLAYVATGAGGVSVIDVSDPQNPHALYQITGAHGGEARMIALSGSQLLAGRLLPNGSWALDVGVPGSLQVLFASVDPGQVVPRNLPSILVVFSTAIDASAAEQAFSLTADGIPVTGALEAGSANAQASTILFRPDEELPAGAQLHLEVSTLLTTPPPAPLTLTAPFVLDFSAATDDGPVPALSQMVPRVGPVAGGQISEVLGASFDAQATVTIGGAPAQVLAASPTRLTVQVPPGAAGLADVVVTNPTGLTSRLPGGYLYSPPTTAETTTPLFLDPRGGSTVTVTGHGFLPVGLGALSGSQVLVRGLPARSVQVLSTTLLKAVAGPGSFGPADITVISPDLTERSVAPHAPIYGLPFSGEEKAVAVYPAALAGDPTQAQLIYSNAGPSGSGNTFSQPYLGPLTGGGIIPESFRVVTYDVGTPGRPSASGDQIVKADDAQADRFFDFLRKAALESDIDNILDGPPLPDVEIMPDSMDVAMSGGRLYVANGFSGLAVLDGNDPVHLPVLGRLGSTAMDGELATRVIPTATGAIVLTNALVTDPEDNSPCETRKLAYGDLGGAFLIDTRSAQDPVFIKSLPVPNLGELTAGNAAQPYGGVVADGRLFLAMGAHQGIQFCPQSDGLTYSPPPPPDTSVIGGGTQAQRTGAYKRSEHTTGALVVYSSASADATPLATVTLPWNVTDVAVVRGYAVIAAPEFGLVIYDVSNPAAPVEVKRLPFDLSLSNNPGQPVRLRLVGDVLFVAANLGGPAVVDLSDPQNPVFVSAGNRERAMDVHPVGDRLMLAGFDRLTELGTPFTYVTGVTPARGQLVPPALPEVVIRFDRPLAEPSVTPASVRLVGPNGNEPLTLSTTSDFLSQTFAIHAALSSALLPNASYEIQVDTSVTDQRGGALLTALHSTFNTAGAGAKAPQITAIAPNTARRSGGTLMQLQGASLSGVTQVTISGNAAQFSIFSDSTIDLTAPASATAGPADLVVVDQSGIRGVVPAGVLYLDDPATRHYTLNPDHGPVAGGTEVLLTATDGAPFAPGTTVKVGGVSADSVHVKSLSTMSFVTPRSDTSQLAPVEITRPGEAGLTIATFSYDLPVSDTIDLPGFPPRVASDIKLVGTTLYVGVATPNYEGLEIFDVTLPERPIRLGGLRTDGPVHGIDAAGALVLLATDSFGLLLVDATDPTHPFKVDHAVTIGRATAVRLDGSTAWVSTADPTDNFGYLQAFDVGTPGLPLLQSLPLAFDALALDLGPSRFYTLSTDLRSETGAGLSLDILDASAHRIGTVLVEAGAHPFSELVRSRVAVRGHRAYVTLGNRLYVYDLSDEHNPVALQSTDLGDLTAGITWAAGGLFVATAGNSTVLKVPAAELLVVSVSPADGALASPAAPVRVEMSLPTAPASVTADTFHLTSDTGSGETPIPGSITVDFTLRGAILGFTPLQPFTPGARVRVYVSGVTGFDSTVHQGAPFQSSFVVAPLDSVKPTLDSITPATGLSDVYTPAVIAGSGFRAGTRAFVGGQEAQVTSLSATQLALIVPPSPGLLPGAASVEVRDSSGLFASRLGGFRYADHLRLVSVSPSRATQAGGIAVDVRGAGFAPGLGVAFGQTDSFSVEVIANDRATVIAPPNAAGKVDVVAALGAQTARLTGAFLYGAGAVATLPAPPIRDVLVDGTAAYIALGGIADITGTDGTVYEQGRATQGGGLQVVDVGEPTNARVVAQLNFSGAGGVRALTKLGDRLYIAAGPAGTEVVDVSLPAHPQVVTTLPAHTAATAVAARDDVLLAGDAVGVSVYTLTETSQPLLVRSLPLPGVTAMAFAGPLALVATSLDASGPALHVLDATRGDLAELGKIALSAPAHDVVSEGRRAYVSLGTAAQVAIVDLTDPTAPAPAGTLLLAGSSVGGQLSAERARTVGGLIYVAAGSGEVQRFTAPLGQQPHALETATVFGAAESLASVGNYLLVGTLFLDVSGRDVELPLAAAADKAGALAGALDSVALEHLELRRTTPAADEIASVNTRIEAAFSLLPDPATADAVTLELDDATHAPIAVQRRVASSIEGGSVVLTPLAQLAPSTSYILRIAPTLSDLSGAQLGAEATVRFRTASDATGDLPVVTSASPAYGLAAGGEAITVLGSGFLLGCTVQFGEHAAPVQSVSADGNAVTVTAPAGEVGLASIRVTNPSGLTGLRNGVYRYLVPPTLTAVSPVEAPMNSRTVVRIAGAGLFPGSQVLFGGVPARQVTLDLNGDLLAVTPDGVIGGQPLTVSTPFATVPATATWPGGFTFTLPRLSSTTHQVEAFATTGDALLVAGGGVLTAYDTSFPESPVVTQETSTVTSVGGLAIVGTDLLVAGSGAIVRYDLGSRCGSAPRAPCSLIEVERVPFANTGAPVDAFAATDQAAFVGVANDAGISLLGEVDGALQVVAQAQVQSGVVRALGLAPHALAVLVQDGGTGRLELRALDDGGLTLLSSVALTGTVRGLGLEGSTIAVGASDGVSLIDALDPSSPALLGHLAGGTPNALAVSGPWILAANGDRLSLIDTTGPVLTERTWARAGSGAPASVAINSGVALLGFGNQVQAFDLPYSTLIGLTPAPGGTLSPGDPVTTTFSSRLPLDLVTRSSLSLSCDGSVVAGTPDQSGTTLRFTPDAPLAAGSLCRAAVTFATGTVVGANTLGAFGVRFVGGQTPSQVRVDSIAPNHSGLAGGVPVVITGAGFDADTTASFGGALAQKAAPSTESTLTVIAPASTIAGAVRVRITTGAGDTLEVPHGFVYVAPLSFVSATPPTVDLLGDTVHITGTGFTRGMSVLLAGATTTPHALGPSGFDLDVPAGPAGPLDLELDQSGAAPVFAHAAITRRDQRPPDVVSWTPLDQSGVTAVPQNTDFTVRFSEAIDPASASQLRLVRQGSATPEDGTTTVSSDQQAITLHPSQPLLSTTYYTLIADGVADVSGNAIAPGRAQKQFRTQDTVPPIATLALVGRGLLTAGTLLSASVDWAFTVSGTDDSGNIASTRLSLDGQALSRAGDGAFHYTWPQSAVGTSSLLHAVARDAAGNEGSVDVTVQIVADQPPTVSFTQPLASAVTVEEGAALTVSASAADQHALSRLEIDLDGHAIARATPPLGASATASTLLRFPPVQPGSSEEHTLSAIAIDDLNQPTSAVPVSVTVVADATPPSVGWVSPADGAHVVSGSQVVLVAQAADANGVRSLVFSADGVDLPAVSQPPWRASWKAPSVTSPRSVSFSVRATDPRGNTGTAQATLTIDPPASGPFVNFTQPSDRQTVQEGTPVLVSVQAGAPAGVAQVTLSLGEASTTLTAPPWQTTFLAPPTEGQQRSVQVSALVTDRAGGTATALHTLFVNDDGAQAPTLTLTSLPAGPLFAGGSTLELDPPEPLTFPGTAQLFVDGDAVGPQSPLGVLRRVLPQGPDGASVSFVATGVPGDATPVTGSIDGTLLAFTDGPPVSIAGGQGTVAALLLADDSLYLARTDGGGGGTLERHARSTGALLSTRPLDGTPTGLAVGQDAIAVTLARTGSHALTLFARDLSTSRRLPLPRPPSGVAAVSRGFAVATDEGLTLVDSATGLLASTLPVGPVNALASDGDLLAAVSQGALLAIDASTPSAPVLQASTTIAGATSVAILPDGRLCAGTATAVRCDDLAHDTLQDPVALPAPALALAAEGQWLSVSAASGVVLFDARDPLVSAGLFPALAGLGTTDGSELIGGSGSVRQGLSRGVTDLAVSIAPPLTAAPGD